MVLSRLTKSGTLAEVASPRFASLILGLDLVDGSFSEEKVYVTKVFALIVAIVAWKPEQL